MMKALPEIVPLPAIVPLPRITFPAAICEFSVMMPPLTVRSPDQTVVPPLSVSAPPVMVTPPAIRLEPPRVRDPLPRESPPAAILTLEASENVPAEKVAPEAMFKLSAIVAVPAPLAFREAVDMAPPFRETVVPAGLPIDILPGATPSPATVTVAPLVK